MKKIIFEFLVTVCLFFILWFSLSKINWVSIFNINELNAKTEEQLGELTWKYFSNSENEINNPEVNTILDSLVYHITDANNIDYDFIKVHLVESDEVNAFALPNGHLVLNTELIKDSKNQEELLGVISHELAHIQLKHVTNKLAKEIGLVVVISAVTGSNNEVIGRIVHKLSSTAFDRKYEEEADLTALKYLENGNIDPIPFANFLARLGEDESELSEYLIWVSTHPNSKERSESILKKRNQSNRNYIQVIDSKTWENFQNLID